MKKWEDFKKDNADLASKIEAILNGPIPKNLIASVTKKTFGKKGIKKSKISDKYHVEDLTTHTRSIDFHEVQIDDPAFKELAMKEFVIPYKIKAPGVSGRQTLEHIKDISMPELITDFDDENVQIMKRVFEQGIRRHMETVFKLRHEQEDFFANADLSNPKHALMLAMGVTNEAALESIVKQQDEYDNEM